MFLQDAIIAARKQWCPSCRRLAITRPCGYTIMLNQYRSTDWVPVRESDILANDWEVFNNDNGENVCGAKGLNKNG